MDRQQLERCSRPELIALAGQHRLKGRHRMRKQQLMQVLSALLGSAEADVSAQESTGRVVDATQAAARPSVPPMVAAVQSHEPAGDVIFAPPAQQSEFPGHDSQLSARYDRTVVVLLVRDPWWLHTYWEVQPERVADANQRLEREQDQGVGLALRLYDVTDSEADGSQGTLTQQINVPSDLGSWYIQAGGPNRAWRLEIGVVGTHGAFIVLATSNTVRAPRSGPAELLDEEWLSPDEDFWQLCGVAGGFEVGLSSGEIRQRLTERFQHDWSSGTLLGASK